MSPNSSNFQLELNWELESLSKYSKKPSLLLHCCCAPCASYVLEYLAPYFSITAIFSNSNIVTRAEFDRRLDALFQLLAKIGYNIPLIVTDYDHSAFLEITRGLETELEGGARCDRCIASRLCGVFERARADSFDYFATTLTVGPRKRAERINAIGQSLATQELRWLPADFKKRGGYQRSVELSRQFGLYRQSFCGCEFGK